MPDMDAYDAARNTGVRGDLWVYANGLIIMEAMDDEGEGDLERE